MKKIVFICLLSLLSFAGTTPPALQIALLKYNGGGDWYANPTSLPNLIKFCNQNLGTNINPDNATVDVGSDEIFNYPFIHMKQLRLVNILGQLIILFKRVLTFIILNIFNVILIHLQILKMNIFSLLKFTLCQEHYRLAEVLKS